MSLLRRDLAIAGLAGLLANGLVAAGAAWLVMHEALPILLPYPWVTLSLAVVLGGISLAEIPMMVYTIRRLAADPVGSRRLAVGLNTLFCFFAAVYGVPIMLLTGTLGWGLALCALGLARLAASLLWGTHSQGLREES